jgi:N-acetyl sugar amidotransferase
MEIRFCKKCVMPSTRPRIQFDEEGICNACKNTAKKENVDWKARWKKLEELCDKFRKTDGTFDVIVPVSGGKNSSYVAWKLKHELGMHPLCVNVRSPLQTKIGHKNLQNFADSGFNLMEISANGKAGQAIAKQGLINEGQAQLDWLFALMVVPIKVALAMNVPLVMYGEEGESEYGGSKELENSAEFGLKHIKKFYHSGLSAQKVLGKRVSEFSEDDLAYYSLPDEDSIKPGDLFAAHFSHFEPWNENHHLELAVEKCGFEFSKEDTFHESWHLAEDTLYTLHMYLAYLKYGFDRANADACILIRTGELTREEGIKLVKEKGGKFPKQHLQKYLDYYKMTEEEFMNTLEKFRNKDIWENVNGKWQLKATLE